jgi:hypothetical protein
MLLLGVGDLPKLLANPDPVFGDPLTRFSPGLLSVVRKSKRTGACPGLEPFAVPFELTREPVDNGTAAPFEVKPSPVVAFEVGKMGVVRYTLKSGGREAGTDDETRTRPLGPTFPTDPFVEVVEVGIMGRVVEAAMGLASETGAGFVELGSLLWFRGLETPGLLAMPTLVRLLDISDRPMGFAAGC